ncbi:porin [Hyalangium rubrum]|uniref:Porin n=1 Tax=Hyalangium rubrum TaxID=3103134 RepID=A0ABU5HCT0_9BACT|nr:porin [Hyalangium sp. s54d21]MDY7229915.1 porin [Hyalangium sp. s54d21]
MTKNLLVALLTLASGAARAQAAEPQPAATPPAETSPAQPSEAPPAPTEAAPTETAATPSIEERLTTDEGKVAALEEQNIETKSDLSLLKKLKISGYVQSRYQYQQPDEDEANPGVHLNDGFSRFTVRRGRIKTTYNGDMGLLMLQVDIIPTAVALRDAEATLYIPGTKQNLSVTLGQMKLPFGYEAPQSSSDREFPERTRVVGAYLPGERDRGLRFNGKFGVMRVAAGFFDGNGISNSNFFGVDNDKEKDFVGRLGFDLKWISGGVSGWKGTTLGKRTTGPNPDAFRTAYDRDRVGADLQVYLDLLPLGGTALKGEFIGGTAYQRNNVEQLGIAGHGYYALLVQNIGIHDILALRYEYFDGQNGLDAIESGSRLGTNNAIGTLGIAAIHNFGETIELTAAYELSMTETVNGGTAKDPSDNLFTLQLQARY